MNFKYIFNNKNIYLKLAAYQRSSMKRLNKSKMKKSSALQSKKVRNIGGTQEEPFWRYTRPELETKIEGRGGSTRTVVGNMGKIAKAIKIEQIYPTKFFSMELGSRVRCFDDTGVSAINGRHDKETLEELLDKFIVLFVLCPECKLPEISLTVVGKDGTHKLAYDCDACGSAKSLKVNHKLKTFILKNPPAPKKRMPTSKRDEDELHLSAGPIVVHDDVEDVVWFTDTSKEAQDARRREAEGGYCGKFLDLKEEEEDGEEVDGSTSDHEYEQEHQEKVKVENRSSLSLVQEKPLKKPSKVTT